jgi:uncharacterized protein with HEPN domain
LVHILSAIETIQSLLVNKKLDDMKSDLLLSLAIERSFEIICEASRRIPDNVKTQHPEIDWRGMVDFGNELRHAYHRINPQTLMEIAARDLPPLKEFAERVIKESKQ